MPITNSQLRAGTGALPLQLSTVNYSNSRCYEVHLIDRQHLKTGQVSCCYCTSKEREPLYQLSTINSRTNAK
ncbi:MAG: hypothetical protein ACRC62_09195 [Microcoleus sp.]